MEPIAMVLIGRGLLDEQERTEKERLKEEAAKHRSARRPPPELCDYCGERPPEGYVAAYNAWVCGECYEDHHDRF